jgi:histone deacetylase 1/2
VSYADPILFVKVNNDDFLYLLLYVDDIILTGTSPQLIEEIKVALKQKFDMTDLGILHYFLGVEVLYPSSGGIFINQSRYAREVIKKAGLLDATPVLTPFQSGTKLLKGDSTNFLDAATTSQFRSIVGCLQYLTFTRPDIGYSVNTVCQFL